MNQPPHDDPRNDPWNDPRNPPRDDPWNDPPPPFHELPAWDSLPQDQPPRYAPGTDPTDAGTPQEIIPLGSSIRLYLAWTAIVACTVVIAALQYIAINSPELLDPDSSPGFNTIYLGRVSVGMNQALGMSDPSYLAAMDQIAHESPYQATNQLRAAIVAGELESREEVMQRLHATAAGQAEHGSSHNPAQTHGWTGVPLNSENPEEVRADHALLTRIYGPEQYVPDASDSDQLIQRHGWFGELAASYNLAESDPVRLGPRQSAGYVVWYIFSLVGVAMLALLVGLCLLITLIVMLATGKLTTHMPTGTPSHRTAYLETLAVFLISFILIQVPLGIIMVMYDVDLTLVMLITLVLPIFWPLLFGVKFRQFRHDMGWVAPNGIMREIGAGLGGYVAGLPVIAVGMGLTFLVGMLSEQAADHPIGHEMVNGNLLQILTLILAAVVWAPLVEESIFRAAFYRHLRRLPNWTGWVLATVISSFIFAAIHPQGYVGIPALMAIAFVLASLRERRQSLIPSITAHALHNGTLITMLLVVLYL